MAETVAFLSRLMTLEPGDVISTGTPAGVGFTREPPVWLRPATWWRSRSTASACCRTRSPVVDRPVFGSNPVT